MDSEKLVDKVLSLCEFADQLVLLLSTCGFNQQTCERYQSDIQRMLESVEPPPANVIPFPIKPVNNKTK